MLSPGSLYIYLINCEEIGDIDAQEAVPPVNTRLVRKFLSYLLLFSSFFPSGFFLLFALCFAQKKKKSYIESCCQLVSTLCIAPISKQETVNKRWQ